MRVTPEQVDQMLHPQFSQAEKDKATRESASLHGASTPRQVQRSVRFTSMQT